MRQKAEKPLPLYHIFPDHQMSRELEEISEILDENPQISELVLQDLCDDSQPGRGASGLSAEFVLRAAIVKQLHGFSYEQLAFHLVDSQSFRSFVRHPLGWTANKSTLQRNICRISAATWIEINTLLVDWARREKLEKGERIRIDSTAVESNIHHPTDSGLLYDAVRTVSRLLGQLKERQAELEADGQSFAKVVFSNHTRRAKRRAYQVANGRGAKRQRAYRDLLKVARKTYDYAIRALTVDWPGDMATMALLVSLEHYLKLMARVIDQTERRILGGESVPAEEKIVSIFEEHTDIIKKGGREVVFGHKIFLSCGRSSLILNCEVLPGNPADAGRLKPLLETHHELYGRYPRQIAADRGFYSGSNLKWARQREGLQDAAFDRKGSVKISDMARSSWIYRQLKRFRAGIEGCVSWLKRVFGLNRCTWKGWEHFCQYVQASVVSYNLLVLARLLL